ncbi:MAG: hypothetical protein IPH16_07015 [Haliscomenobacter sp.]|nr:hypothetical protein [Haliscomenobacter sp.]
MNLPGLLLDFANASSGSSRTRIAVLLEIDFENPSFLKFFLTKPLNHEKAVLFRFGIRFFNFLHRASKGGVRRSKGARTKGNVIGLLKKYNLTPEDLPTSNGMRKN